MLLNEYLLQYLQFYDQVNLLGMGTLYKVTIPVKEENKELLPSTYTYKLDHLASNSIEHFALFINQYEKKDFEQLRQELLEDFQYGNAILNEGRMLKFEGIGSIRIFNKEVRLFNEEDPNRTFGYPTIQMKD